MDGQMANGEATAAAAAAYPALARPLRPTQSDTEEVIHYFPLSPSLFDVTSSALLRAQIQFVPQGRGFWSFLCVSVLNSTQFGNI